MSYGLCLSDRDKESIKQEDTYFKENQTYSLDNRDEEYNEGQSLIKVEINIGNGEIKELNIYSMNDIDKSIDNFCTENNLPKEAKIPIKNLLLEELNKKISLCKFYII